MKLMYRHKICIYDSFCISRLHVLLNWNPKNAIILRCKAVCPLCIADTVTTYFTLKNIDLLTMTYLYRCIQSSCIHFLQLTNEDGPHRSPTLCNVTSVSNDKRTTIWNKWKRNEKRQKNGEKRQYGKNDSDGINAIQRNAERKYIGVCLYMRQSISSKSMQEMHVTYAMLQQI